MPYADPEKAREYQRNYQRQRRNGSTDSTAVDLPTAVRIKTAEDVLTLLEDTINSVRGTEADALVKARCVGSLAGVTLKAIEITNVEARLVDVEEMLRQGGGER